MAWIDRPGLLRTAAGLALLGAPVYWWQGRRLRQRLPRLEEAPGARRGRLEGQRPAYRLAGLGESPMAAVGLAHQSEGLIAQTADRLARATGRTVEWETAARSGATVRDGLSDLLPALQLQRADAVVVAFGVNDCLSIRGERGWRRDLNELLDALRQRLRPATIVVTGVPPMRAFPALPMPLSGMLGLRASLLDTAARRMARLETGVDHLPMALDARQDELFCIDGFHPNARGHARWAEQLAAQLVSHATRPG